MSNAALYARISSLKDDKGVSVERQLDECIRLAKSHGYTIAPEHIYIDNGKSGKNLKRPAIQALLKAIESGAVSHLFIWDIARLSRSVRDTDILLELLGKHKVELFTVSGFSDVTTPEGELLTGFQAQMAQYWRRKTSKSVKDHYAYLRSQGVYLGRRAPFGLVLVGNGKTRRVEPHPDQFPAVVAFFEMYASGEAFASQRGTRLLFERGHLWQDRHGNRFKVTPSHLKKLLANVPLFLPLLSPSLAKRLVKQVALRLYHQENGKRPNTVALLRRIVACESCGRLLVMQNSHRKNPSYQHPISGCIFDARTIIRRIPDSFVLSKLAALENLSQASRAKLRYMLLRVPPDPFHQDRLDRLRIQAQLEKLIDEWLEVGLTPAQFRAKRDTLQSKLDALPEPAPPPVGKTPAEVDALLDNLSANLVKRILAPPAQGNALLSELFRTVTYNFDTRETKAKFTWEA